MLFWVLIFILNWWFGRIIAKKSLKGVYILAAILLSTFIIGVVNFATTKYMAYQLNIPSHLVAQNIAITFVISLFLGGIVCWVSVLYNRRKILKQYEQ